MALPGLPDLTDASDTGASSSDNITKDNTPDIAVTGEIGSTIVLWIDGSPAGGQVANPTAVITTPTLSDGPHTIRAYAVDAAGNFNGLSAALSITVDTTAPSVSTTTLVTFTDDQTPHVTVTAAGLPDYTDVRLDVDLNNDGDFADAGETNRTLASLYNGSAYFQLTPALPATDPLAGPYLVQLRSRVSDIAGNEGVSPRTSLKIDTLGNTMLADYVNAPDATFSVSAAPVQTINGLGGLYTVYVYDLHSQTWRTTADVTTPLWQHWMQIIVPQVDLAHLSSTALLMINGGSTSATPPTTLSDTMKSLGQLAVGTNSIAINLPNVPNEPLYFTDQSPPIGRTEDQIISYTMDKFVHNLGQPGNETWLALLPMVKSAVKAMTAVQMRDSSRADSGADQRFRGHRRLEARLDHLADRRRRQSRQGDHSRRHRSVESR